MLPMDMKPAISDEDFLKFREFFYRKTGIHFDGSKRYFVDKRLLDRVQATGAADFREYFVNLRFQASGEELQKLINLMTVNETYFFREEYQFRCLVNAILPELVSRKKRGERLKIWSLPSSSGEEAYSIAIWLLERWADVNDWDVEIFASDIDTKILDAARQGLYEKRSVAPLPPSYLNQYFTRTADDRYQICEDLRQSVEFSRTNITDLSEMRRFRDFDVIFCRNLLIYFDDASRRIAAEAIFNALAPGGYICLGHSESMSRISSLFRPRKFDDAIVYQKPL